MRYYASRTFLVALLTIFMGIVTSVSAIAQRESELCNDFGCGCGNPGPIDAKGFGPCGCLGKEFDYGCGCGIAKNAQGCCPMRCGTFEMPVTYSYRTTGCCNSDITVPFKVTIPAIQPNTPFQLIVDAGPIAAGSSTQPLINGYGEIRVLDKRNIPPDTAVSNYWTINWVQRCGVTPWHEQKTCSIREGIPAGDYVLYYIESNGNHDGSFGSTLEAYGAIPLKL